MTPPSKAERLKAALDRRIRAMTACTICIETWSRGSDDPHRECIEARAAYRAIKSEPSE